MPRDLRSPMMKLLTLLIMVADLAATLEFFSENYFAKGATVCTGTKMYRNTEPCNNGCYQRMTYGGLATYRKATCTATHTSAGWYSDSACTTLDSRFMTELDTNDLSACGSSDSCSRYRKFSTISTTEFYFAYATYNGSSCAAADRQGNAYERYNVCEGKQQCVSSTLGTIYYEKWAFSGTTITFSNFSDSACSTGEAIMGTFPCGTCVLFTKWPNTWLKVTAISGTSCISDPIPAPAPAPETAASSDSSGKNASSNATDNATSNTTGNVTTQAPLAEPPPETGTVSNGLSKTSGSLLLATVFNIVMAMAQLC